MTFFEEYSDDIEGSMEEAADLRAHMERHKYCELARAKTATGPQIRLPNVPLTTKGLQQIPTATPYADPTIRLLNLRLKDR
jgi:hypothetical protein